MPLKYRQSPGNSMQLTEEMFNRATEVLKLNATKDGIRAAATQYNQIWSRDTFITLLGANMLEDPLLLEAAKNSIITLGKSQSRLGMIPVNYDLDNNKPRFFFAGSTDSSSWYIIGLANLYNVTKDKELLREPLTHAIDAYVWLRHQDAKNILLIESQPGADWMDNAVKRQGTTLYNNVLFLISTICINKLCEESGRSLGPKYALDYHELKDRFTEIFSPSEQAIRSGIWPNVVDYDRDFLTKMPSGRLQFHPNFLTFNHVDMHFDSLSNLMCILAGISSSSMSSSIISYIKSNQVASPYPIKVMHPNYLPGDPFLDEEYTSRKPEHWRNDQYCYHNGGIWPFVGGFYALALNKLGDVDSKSVLESLAKVNSLTKNSGELGFNEWLHGQTAKPLGQDGQSWSAGMYIAAYLASKGKDPFGFLK